MIDAAVLAALNHVLSQADWAPRRLAPFAGRQARISMPPWHLCFEVAEDGTLAPAAGDPMPDVEVELPANTPVLALQGMEKVMQAARIEGAAQFAQELGYVFSHLRWDYEEDLSRVIGDIAAHRLAGALTSFGAWQKRGLERAAEGFVAYATEKNPLLARHGEQQGFADGVAQLRAALERAERRLDALARTPRPRTP
jgi:ubiquinone biosynthesis protein UbiJ